MRKFHVMLLMCLAFTLCSASCDQQLSNAEDRIGANEQSLSTAEDVADKVGTLATVVGATIPPTQPITSAIVAICGLIGTGLAVWRGSIHKRRAGNYSQALDAGIIDGGDQTIVDVSVVEKHLDNDTKAHFNTTGATKL